METIALYSNGETIGWQDRIAIACMKKLGFPADHTDWLSRYGWGEFAFKLRILRPEKILPELVKRLSEPLMVAHRDDGSFYANNHQGSIVFEFVPRASDEPRRAFATFDEMRAFSMAREEPVFPLPLLQQYQILVYTMTRKTALKKADRPKLMERLHAVLPCQDLRTAPWHGFLYAISPSLGLFLKLEDEGRKSSTAWAARSAS